MKLISLEIDGINSFQKKTVIDFKTLSEKGIFGIFGKTGSGKSTVQDCIYLALFGIILRTKKPSEFINLARKDASVKFIFEVEEFSEDAESTIKTYEIKRSFKKLGDNARTVETAVMHDITGSERILIAKTSDEVTAEVSKILEFGADEFATCFAPPQGDYAKLLKDSKSGKLSIIAKIFNIDIYGEKLFKKCAKKLVEAEKKLAFLEGVISEHSSFSEGELDDNKNELKRIRQEIDNISGDYAETKKLLLARQKLAVLEEEASANKEELDDLEERKETEALRKKKLDIMKMSHKAAPTLIYISACEQEIEIFEHKLKTLDEKIVKASEEIARLTAYGEEEKTKDLLAVASLEIKKKMLIETSSNKYRIKRVSERVKTLEEDLLQKQKRKEDAEKINLETEAELEKLLIGFHNLNEQTGGSASISYLSDARIYDKTKNELEIYESLQRENAAKVKALEDKREEMLQDLLKTDAELSGFRKELSLAKESLSEFYGEDNTAEKNISEAAEFRQKIEFAANKLFEVKLLKKEKEEELFEFNKEISGAESEISKYEINVAEFTKEFAKLAEKREKILFQREKYFGENLIDFLKNEIEPGVVCPVCEGIASGLQEVGNQISLNSFDFELENIKHRSVEVLRNKDLSIKKLAEAKQNLLFMKEEIKRLKKEIGKLDVEIEKIEYNFPQFKNAGESKVNNAVVLAVEALDTLVELFNSVNGLKELCHNKERVCTKISAVIDEIDKQIADLNRNSENLATKIAEQNIKILKFGGEFDGKTIGTEILGFEKRKAEEESVNAKQLKIMKQILSLMKEKESASVEFVEATAEVKNAMKLLENAQAEKNEIEEKIALVDFEGNIETELKNITQKIDDLRKKIDNFLKEEQDAIKLENSLKIQKANLISAYNYKQNELKQVKDELFAILKLAKISEAELMRETGIEDVQNLEEDVINYETKLEKAREKNDRLNALISEHPLKDVKLSECEEKDALLESEYLTLTKKESLIANKIKHQEEMLAKIEYFTSEKEKVSENVKVLTELHSAIQGEKLVKFISESYIISILEKTNATLALLTSGRYQLVYAEDDFVVADNLNGGETRSINTLSGGETFITSLSLILAISEIISMTKNKALGFMFLDEGFGTLDSDSLEMVMIALRRLNFDKMSIGIISHEEVIKGKIAKKIEVEKNEDGSFVKLVI